MRPAPRDGIPPLENHALGNHDGMYDEGGNFLIVVMAGIGHGAGKGLVNDLGRLVRHIPEHVECLLGIHSPYDLGNDLCLFRRNSNVGSECFHELFVTGVSDESASERKFAEFVSDHVFRYENGNVILAIVDAEGVTYELRGDSRTSRPGLDDGFFARLVENHDFSRELLVDEWSFFKTACHG